jgi:hypothetical protein
MAATRHKSFRARLKEEGQSLLIELIQLAGFLFILKAGEVLVRWLFHDALVFGVLPKEWLFDAGDIGLIFCFCWRSCTRLLRRND